MMFGPRNPTRPADAYFVILLGQSNADGRREPTRLQNTQYNYKGIGAGYPTVRAAQAQYVVNPSNVYIYYKSVQSTDDMSVDNATWEPYVAGVNSSHDDNSFGTELSCAVQINDITGRPVYIIKVAYGGTSLNTNTPSAAQFPPGNWNPTNRYIAAAYYIQRALRDFRSENPTLRAQLLCINWWQGENDAINGVSTATYQAQFELLKTYVDKSVAGEFVQPQGLSPIWNITKLYFSITPAEALINDAFDNLAGIHSDINLIEASPYPRGIDLTVAEASPLAKATPPATNGDGGLDNNHTAYIGLLGIGEYQADNVQTAGLI